MTFSYKYDIVLSRTSLYETLKNSFQEFHIMLGMSLRMSPALSFRQSLEQSLYTSLTVSQLIQITVILYLKREEDLTRLYRKALRKGKVKLYDKHGMKFEYALIQKKDVPDWLTKKYGMAFSQCLYSGFEAFFGGVRHAMSRGSWLLFVVEDMYPNIPEEYIEYSAVHERGEQVTLGDHNLASKLEFSIAKKERKLVEYIEWLEKHSPEKFADIFNYQVHLDLPDDSEFENLLRLSVDSEESMLIRNMIDSFDWPTILLKKLKFCKSQSDKVLQIIVQAMDSAKITASFSNSAKELVTNIEAEVRTMLRYVKTEGLMHYADTAHNSDVWRDLRRDVDSVFLESINRRREILGNEVVNAEVSSEEDFGGLPDKGVLSISFISALRSA